MGLYWDRQVGLCIMSIKPSTTPNFHCFPTSLCHAWHAKQVLLNLSQSPPLPLLPPPPFPVNIQQTLRRTRRRRRKGKFLSSKQCVHSNTQAPSIPPNHQLLTSLPCFPLLSQHLFKTTCLVSDHRISSSPSSSHWDTCLLYWLWHSPPSECAS